MCLKVGLVLTGENLGRARQAIEGWAATTRRVQVDWDAPSVLESFTEAPRAEHESIHLHLGDRETGCACGLAIERPRGWRRSAMSDLSFLLSALAAQPVKTLRFGVTGEGEGAALEQVALSLPQFRRLVKRGALGRNHLYTVACG